MASAPPTSGRRPESGADGRRPPSQRAASAAAFADRRVNIALIVTAGVAAAAGWAGIWLALAVMILSRALAGRPRSVLASMPAAALLTAALLVAVLTAASAVGVPVLSSAAGTRLMLGLLSTAAGAAVACRRSPRAGLANRSEMMACAPAGTLLVLGALLSRQDLPDAVGGFLIGWDNGAHALYSAEIARAGELSYEDRSYPRGLHAIVALVLTARRPLAMTPASFEDLLRVQSLTVWVLFSLLACTVALTTLRLGALQRFPAPLAVTAGVGAGLATLSPYFFGFTMKFGFETSIAVALVLAVVTLELLQGRGASRTLLITAAGVLLTAHTYQLLLPVVAVPLLAAGVTLLRHQRRAWPLTLGLAAALILTAGPPVWAVARNEGVAAVATPGATAGLPLFWVLAGALSAIWLAAIRVRHARLLASMVLVVIATALCSAWLSGATLSSYYPRKLFWHAAVLALPMLVVVATSALLGFTRWTRHVPVIRILSGAVGGFTMIVLAFLAVPGPYMAVSGGWNVPGDVAGVLMHPEEPERICVLNTEFGRQVAFRMQAFYGAPEPSLGALPPCPAGPVEP